MTRSAKTNRQSAIHCFKKRAIFRVGIKDLACDFHLHINSSHILQGSTVTLDLEGCAKDCNINN